MLKAAMVQLSDIHPVTDFTRKAKQYIQRLQQTGRPEVLTVNGQAAIVVQSADAYQKLLDAVARGETLPIAKKTPPEAKRGGTYPAQAAPKEVATLPVVAGDDGVDFD